MAIEYCLGSASLLSAAAGQRLLMQELDLRTTAEGSDWFSNSGVLFMLRESFSVDAGEVQEEFAGFRPAWGIRMRPRVTISEEIYDLAFSTMIRAVDCLLRHTQEDLFFSYEWERMYVLRRDGRVALCRDFDHRIGERFRDLLTVPYSFEDLKP